MNIKSHQATDDTKFLAQPPNPDQVAEIRPNPSYEGLWTIEFRHKNPSSGLSQPAFWRVQAETLEAVWPEFWGVPCEGRMIHKLEPGLGIVIPFVSPNRTARFDRFLLVNFIVGEDTEIIASSSNYWTLYGFAKTVRHMILDWTDPQPVEVERLIPEIKAFRRNQAGWLKSQRTKTWSPT